MRMHADQVDVAADAVARLVAAQFPQWRALPVRPVASHGTVNALFRLGDEVVVRLPLRPDDGAGMRESLRYEQDVARRFAAHTTVPVPEPLGLGEPGADYPGWWSAYRWIAGETADAADVAGSVAFARDLAGFVREVRGIDTGGRGWDGRSRGGPLATRDAGVRTALRRSAELVDVDAIARVWDRCRDAAAPSGPDVWLHADLMPGNLLVRPGRLAAVIDLGTACIGDPAVDLMPAWNLLSAGARAAFRDVLQIDDATWDRGRGWALLQAIVALPYYVDTNPSMAATARHTLAAVLES
ncbi:aminoglycoside phosphotransferase family protein [Dactylosporangium sp. CA-139114]|uniref:aminoglycoside phosphotransferase family protein n=1 Tax=Dactylosporangium sp. CA-139114 TaxID=3239931 RepID=UPI003D95EA67